MKKMFMGIDSSTQSLKAVFIDEKLKIISKFSVNFDKDLPEFGTQGGVHKSRDGLTVTSPPLMWCKALDLLLDKIAREKIPLKNVMAVSGSGQQHGSVWLKKGACDILRKLDADKPLYEQAAGIFSFKDSPVWMDSSTTAYCRKFEKKMGSADIVAKITGSRAYERFTGSQIAKRFDKERNKYFETERISLVSSFMASLFIGDYAPVDFSDGSGMNLLDINTRRWPQKALDFTAPGLLEKLGEPVASYKVVGKIHPWFVKRYGFNPECVIVAFSGDNPNSLAGLRAKKAGEIIISLGTSDTIFASLKKPKPSPSEGHIFVNPVAPDGYMALICYKNGSLTREYVRNSLNCRSWKEFGNLVAHSPVGNSGNIGFFIKEPEITPPILRTGIYRFNNKGQFISSFAPEVEARAVLEGQFLSMRLHGGNIGIKPVSILVTGGASVDKTLIRIIADVFGVSVYAGDEPDSAALGAAYRALHGWKCDRIGKFVLFENIVACAPKFKLVAKADMNAHKVYTAMLLRYAALEKKVVGKR